MAPTPAEIRAARGTRTQTQAAALVHTTLRTWQRWEAGAVPMPLESWELFQLKTGVIELFELMR